MAAAVFDVPQNSNLDMSSFPAIDTLAPIDPNYMTLYDFSGVRNIDVNSPPANIGPANCSATNATFQDSGSCTWSCGTCTRISDIVTCPRALNWGLTFDDGPSPFTPELLDYLQTKDIRASFFVVGSRAKQYPQTILRAFQEGHQIAVHTWSHRALTTLSTEQVVAELHTTLRAIEQIIGTRPLYMRPPFGDIDDRIRDICKAMNLVPVLWDLDSGDFGLGNRFPGAPTGEAIIDSFATAANRYQNRASGLISLQHDLYEVTSKIAPSTIDKVLTTRMKLMPVSECQNDPAPYTDKSLRIPPSMTLEPVTTPGGVNNKNSAIKTVINFLSILPALLI